MTITLASNGNNDRDTKGDARPVSRPLSIASVTVLYNGAHVLRRHLDALKEQSRKIDEIIVVNNASSDESQELLAQAYPEVKVINLSRNCGVGGGLAAGLDYAAISKNHDWIWLFDQDSVPSHDGLELLLAARSHLDDPADNVAILAPECVHPETKMTCPGLSWRGGCLLPVPKGEGRAITFVDSVISSGSLIRRSAVEAAGLPRSDFFMDFVDYEHCLRLRRQGFRIAVVHESVTYHTLGDPKKFNILGRTKYWTDHLPWREYYMTRNEIFTIWQYYPQWKTKSLTLYRLARHALVLLLFGRRKLACMAMMFRGYRDGRLGRLGIRFSGEEASRTLHPGGPASRGGD
jgi:GT2 family glycosyltransferase